MCDPGANTDWRPSMRGPKSTIMCPEAYGRRCEGQVVSHKLSIADPGANADCRPSVRGRRVSEARSEQNGLCNVCPQTCGRRSEGGKVVSHKPSMCDPDANADWRPSMRGPKVYDNVSGNWWPSVRRGRLLPTSSPWPSRAQAPSGNRRGEGGEFQKHGLNKTVCGMCVRKLVADGTRGMLSPTSPPGTTRVQTPTGDHRCEGGNLKNQGL